MLQLLFENGAGIDIADVVIFYFWLFFEQVVPDAELPSNEDTILKLMGWLDGNFLPLKTFKNAVFHGWPVCRPCVVFANTDVKCKL